ncbi:MAG TPA: hypothetical protein VMH26_09400 [Burkholderiales bacterium]|nr:hypothetical protein [Burkholderiales bacterium]
MADVAPVPFINFGLSQAQQADASAAANLQGQQAAGLAMQNKIMAAKLPMMLDAFRGAEQHITDFSGQHNGDEVPTPEYNPAANDSGAAPPGSNANVRVSPYDLIGRDGGATNVVQGAVQGKYNVDPSGTPQEQAKIRAAYDYQQRINLLGDKGLSDSAAAQLDAAKYERDMAVKDRLNKAGLDASKYYEALQNVTTADHPWQQLYAVDKRAAMRIKAANPNADDETLDQLAQSAAGQSGAFIHRFTGRPAEKGDDGIYRDKDTQQPVLGVVPAGFKPEDIEKIREKGLEKDTRMVNGREVTQFNYEWAGFDTVDGYVAKAVAQARAAQASQNRIENKRQQAVVIQAHAGTPADARIAAPGQQTPAAQAVDQNNTPAAQGAAAGHYFSKPPGSLPPPRTVVPQPKSPTAAPGDNIPPSANSPNGKLDLSDAQKSNTPNVPGGGLPAGAAPSDADKEYWKKLQARNAEAGQTAGGANTAIQIATSAKNALASGAAHGKTAAYRQMVMTAINNPVALRGILGDASSSAILRKMLGNAAFEQLETDANGNQMRLGSQTIRVAMTQLSASPEMTEDAINALMDQVIKNSQYELQKNGPDYQRYRAAGNDVTDFDRWYDSKYPNKTNIDLGTPHVVKTGKLNGRKVEKMSDGSVRYAQ